jgi:hypothetical protein
MLLESPPPRAQRGVYAAGRLLDGAFTGSSRRVGCGRRAMNWTGDLLYVAITLAFFALTWGLVKLCERV